MRVERPLFFLALFLSPTPVLGAGAYTIWDHGKECAESLGVEVPRFNCLDPNATELPVTVNGRRITEAEAKAKGIPPKCDVPSDGGTPCLPGTRFLKFIDYLSRNGKTEKITTQIICRR